jgi:hypothetical protein
MEPTRHRRDIARHGGWDRGVGFQDHHVAVSIFHKEKTGTTMEEILDRLTSGLSMFIPL